MAEEKTTKEDMLFVSSKEESRAKRKEISRGVIPEGYERGLIYAKRVTNPQTGKLEAVTYAQPFVRRKLSEEEQKKRDAEIQKKRDEKSKEGAKYGLDPMKPTESFKEYRSKISIEKAKVKAQEDIKKIEEREKKLQQKKQELKNLAE